MHCYGIYTMIDKILGMPYNQIKLSSIWIAVHKLMLAQLVYFDLHTGTIFRCRFENQTIQLDHDLEIKLIQYLNPHCKKMGFELIYCKIQQIIRAQVTFQCFACTI